jgi:hypothetical protein
MCALMVDCISSAFDEASIDSSACHCVCLVSGFGSRNRFLGLEELVMERLPSILMDKILVRAGYEATKELCQVNRAWRARAER